MDFFIEVRCLETNETFQFSDFATITYCRIDNSPIRVPQGPAWCNVCNRIQMAEVFPQFITLQERYIEAAKLDPTSESAFIVGERESMEALEIELRELKAYLRKRRWSQVFDMLHRTHSNNPRSKRCAFAGRKALRHGQLWIRRFRCWY